jgi:D-glycero-D-manno-heptose 1,7-bisphosphate phosphatase
MLKQFIEQKISIAKVYYCPHHEEGKLPEYTFLCNDRKPSPGMLLKAKDEFNLDLSSSILIGDKESDIEAAQKAGVRHKVFFNKFKSARADYNVTKLEEAYELIL